MSPDDAKNAPNSSMMSSFARYFDSPPPSIGVQVELGARSQRGPLRPINDDHYLILRLGRQQLVLRTSLPEGETPDQFEEFAYAMESAVPGRPPAGSR